LDHNYIFYTGLPRSGSTLLSSILSQNPNIYSAGNSPVCQLIWDTFLSVSRNCKEQFISSNRDAAEFIEPIFDIYYKNVKSKFIFDKSRSWGHESNIALIKHCITETPKFVVLLRPIIEVFSSFVNLYDLNNIPTNFLYDLMFEENSEPIIRSYNCSLNLIEKHFENCLFIFYDDIINKPLDVISKVYSFCDIENNFTHNLNEIINKFPENDMDAYGVMGMHTVRPTISKRNYTVNIQNEAILELCTKMDQNLLKKYNEKLFYSS